MKLLYISVFLTYTIATVASAALSDFRHVAIMYKPLEVNALKLYLLWRPLPFTGSKVVAKVSMVENFDLKASQPKSASFGEGRGKTFLVES
jgi:hypothetical protein